MTDPRIRVAIMHHPKRAATLGRIIDGCAGLGVEVVTDPRPDGPPSPLRTAQRAWSAVADDATHHLVLQDDVRLVTGFASAVTAAVRARPDAVIALSVNSDSPHNSYRVRRAACAGLPWARLCPDEWVPTLGLLMPAAQARRLGAHLTGVPEELRDDDEVIRDYYQRQGIGIIATVLHLLDHGDLPSVSGNDGDGARHGTVFRPEPHWVPSYWCGPDAPEPVAGPIGPHSVELKRGRCSLRFLRPGLSEPVIHPFPWYWHDNCEQAGVEPDTVLDALEGVTVDLRGVHPAYAVEAWAAGYLLGSDVGSGAAGSPRAAAHDGTADLAFASWIDSGFRGVPLMSTRTASWVDSGFASAADPAAAERERGTLLAMCEAGFAAGSRNPGRAPTTAPTLTQGPDVDPVGRTARSMAAREAAALALPTAASMPHVRIGVLPCGRCDSAAGLDHLRTMSWYRQSRPDIRWVDDVAAAAELDLTLLSCEALTDRAFLVLAAVLGRPRPAGTLSRAAAWQAWHPSDDSGPAPTLLRLDAAERWADDLFSGADDEPADGPRVLPASTRRAETAPGSSTAVDTRAAWRQCRRKLTPSFLSHHASSTPPQLEADYRAALRTALVSASGHP